jgi:hypothetical protein
VRIIPRGTFSVLKERDVGRFRSFLNIKGPIGEYTDDELLLHFGGDARFGDRVDRYDGDMAWLSVWID